ncbi:MAG: hypothetical protein M0T84_02910 [Betaproteobacteria bacterium]|nr:hypothetical protein [Betaproteobacteria bacterium]
MNQDGLSESTLLRAEIEMLMNERQALLRIAGAAAAFVAELDARKLPADTYDAAERLAEYLNMAPEETISDALATVQAHIVDSGMASAESEQGSPE